MAVRHEHQGHTGERPQNVEGRAGNARRLRINLALAASYMVAEVAGSMVTDSLALLADAGHMLSDVAALGLALFAMRMTRRPATSLRTYGYYRMEILAALANAATLIGIALFIFREAVDRFRHPPEVRGPLMLAIAAGGLLVNVIGLLVLHGGRNESLNVKGAWLHVLTDALGSVQAIVAGGLIWAFGFTWVDPLASVLIGLLVIYSSWSLLKESLGVLMENAPGHINVDEVRNTLAAISGVAGVRDLHVWTITSGMVALSAHLIIPIGRYDPRIVQQLRASLREKFGIAHVTIQLDEEECDECRLPV